MSCAACLVEMGIADVTHEWTTITTANTFSDPVLIIGLVTMFGRMSAVARSRVINGTTFEVKITEASCTGSPEHNIETISWMMMEVSTRAGAEASHIELGSDTPGTLTSRPHVVGTWPVNFTASIPSPIVLASIMSVNADGWSTTRATEVDDSGFEMSLQQEFALVDHDMVTETVGYFAVTRTSTALGTIGGFEYWATTTDWFDEMGRCAVAVALCLRMHLHEASTSSMSHTRVCCLGFCSRGMFWLRQN